MLEYVLYQFTLAIAMINDIAYKCSGVNSCETLWCEQLWDALVWTVVRRSGVNSCETLWCEQLWDALLWTVVRRSGVNSCETLWCEQLWDALLWTVVRRSCVNSCETLWCEQLRCKASTDAAKQGYRASLYQTCYRQHFPLTCRRKIVVLWKQLKLVVRKVLQ